MTHQLFLGEPSAVADAVVGAPLLLDGDEGRHAGAVVRLRPGERYFVADGAGRRVLLEATDVDRSSVRGTVLEVIDEPAPSPRFVLVQALAKGDRDEQAIEAATELGVDEVVPWQAERSVVVWRGERAAKSLAKWAAVVTRATKQSRRARMPLTSQAVGLAPLVARVGESALTLVLHEDATEPLASLELPEAGDVLARRRARGRHHRPRGRGPDRSRGARGPARLDDPARLVGGPRRSRGPQRPRPLALTAYARHPQHTRKRSPLRVCNRVRCLLPGVLRGGGRQRAVTGRVCSTRSSRPWRCSRRPAGRRRRP